MNAHQKELHAAWIDAHLGLAAHAMKEIALCLDNHVRQPTPDYMLPFNLLKAVDWARAARRNLFLAGRALRKARR